MPKLVGTPGTPAAPPAATEAFDPEKARAESKLREVNAEIQNIVADLMSCEEKDIPKLSRRAQRLRVASLMLREVITDIADPTTYRELTLLNKLAASGTFEGEDEAEAALEAEAARGRLADVGLNPEDASDMVRALHALQTVMSDDAQREADDAAARPR